MPTSGFYALKIKRQVDRLGAAALLVLLLVPMSITAILIILTMGRPVFYTQNRIGKNGTEFRIYKFRTMTLDSQEGRQHTEIHGYHPAVTPLGRILRRLKIDELPQLWNVFIGDMSFIGPRPALPSQLPLLDDVGQQRLLVHPGLTGLAQVSGNTHLSWEERWRFDARYVNSISLRGDLVILVRTLGVVLLGEARWLDGAVEKGD